MSAVQYDLFAPEARSGRPIDPVLADADDKATAAYEQHRSSCGKGCRDEPPRHCDRGLTLHYEKVRTWHAVVVHLGLIDKRRPFAPARTPRPDRHASTLQWQGIHARRLARTIAELREWLAAVEAWASGTEPTGPYRVTPHVTAVDAAVEALAAIRQDVLDTAPDAPAWAGTFRVQKQMLGRWHVAHLPTRTALPGGDYASADEARRYADAVWPLADWPAIRAVQFEHEWGELAQACLKARKAVRAAQ